MKRVYKLTPVSQYDIAGLESWLSDMARKGLYLKKFRPLFCTFTRGEPKQTRYRIEPCKRALDGEPPQSMLELYQDFGWDYVDEISPSMLIFSTQDLQAPELHTDPELQWEQWNKVRRSLVSSCWINAILAVLILGAALWFLFGKGQPVLALTTTIALPMLISSLLVLAELPTVFSDARKVSCLALQLKEGIPLSHQAFYPRRRLTVVLSFIAAVIILVSLHFYRLPGSGMQNLDYLTDFSPLSLAQVEETDFKSGHYVVSGVDYANFCRQNRYLLCWNQWQVVQTGSRGTDNLWVRMEIMWYDLPGSLLAVPLAREQLNQAMALDDDIWWTSEQTPGWTVDYYTLESADFLAVARSADNSFQAAAVAVGDKVAVIRYTGHGDLAEHLAELAAMVNV